MAARRNYMLLLILMVSLPIKKL